MRTQFPIQLAKEHIILERYTEAITLLRPDAENGHSDAQFLYGFLHFLNPDVSSTDGLNLIRRAAEQGHANANYVLATVHDFDVEYQFEMPRTDDEWHQLRIAVQNESVAATVQMAKAHRDGIGGPKNLRLARKLLKRYTTRNKFPLYADAYYEYALLLLDQREPGQRERAETARELLYAIFFSHNADVMRKARRLMAERIRDPRYRVSRKVALKWIRSMREEKKRRDIGPTRPQWQHFLDDYCRRTLVYDLRDATFEQFVSFLFDHPQAGKILRSEGNWKFIASVSLYPQTMIRYYIRLFQEPAFLVEHYTAEKLNQGFWTMYAGRSWSVGAMLFHREVSPTQVEDCLRAMYDLFAKLFVIGAMSDEHFTSAYMWWDAGYCHFWPYKEPTQSWQGDSKRRHDAPATAQRFNDIILDVLTRILQLESLACKNAALHGLNHSVNPAKKQVILDFLAANPDLPDYESWYQYGMVAIEGKGM